MKTNLGLGGVFGIKIKVHWTFFLMIIWLVFDELKRGGNMVSVWYNIAFTLSVFLCITLHELGHALVARHFKIKTKKITLLPIGGMATLEKILESPKQELLIVVAGPLVNLLIAAILYFTIPVEAFVKENLNEVLFFFNRLTLENFIFLLFLANIGLVLFNSIPAFPMDGGRILRALLALKMNRTKATQIAANIGQFFAILIFILGLLYSPILIFISLFIFLGAHSENIIVSHLAILKGHKIRDAMITTTTTFSPNEPISTVLKTIISSTENNFVVVQEDLIMGVIYHKDIIKHATQEKGLVKDIMTTKITLLQENDDLKKVYELIYSESNSFYPVVNGGQLVGVIDAVNLNEYLLIQTNLAH